MFSPLTRAYFARATAFGRLSSPTHRGDAGSPEQGHYFQVELQIEDGIIRKLAFYCPRCLVAVACGAVLEEAVLEQPMAQAAQLNAEHFLRALGGLPPQRSFYPWLVLQALDQALKGGA